LIGFGGLTIKRGMFGFIIVAVDEEIPAESIVAKGADDLRDGLALQPMEDRDAKIDRESGVQNTLGSLSRLRVESANLRFLFIESHIR
jgi:hypothetical protein